MFVLPIDQTSIDNPRRIDVARIEAVMLWPHDEARRDRAMAVGQCLWQRSLLQQGRLQPAEIEALAMAAVDAPAPVDMVKQAADVFPNGFVAGLLLYLVVAAAEQCPEESAIQLNVQRISKTLFPKWRLRPQTINNNVWRNYRNVAHLWAAFVASSEDVFPCRTADLALFLANAEALREKGEETRTRNSPSPVLRPDEAVRLPANLKLPRVRLHFEAM